MASGVIGCQIASGSRKTSGCFRPALCSTSYALEILCWLEHGKGYIAEAGAFVCKGVLLWTWFRVICLLRPLIFHGMFQPEFRNWCRLGSQSDHILVNSCSLTLMVTKQVTNPVKTMIANMGSVLLYACCIRKLLKLLLWDTLYNPNAMSTNANAFVKRENLPTCQLSS